MLMLEESEARFDEVSWVLDYLDDLESDFSVLHRVDDMYGIPGPRFLRLAVRLPAYDGLMRARAESLMAATEVEDAPPVSRSEPAGSGGVAGNVKVIEPTREALSSSAFAGLIEMG